MCSCSVHSSARHRGLAHSLFAGPATHTDQCTTHAHRLRRPREHSCRLHEAGSGLLVLQLPDCSTKHWCDYWLVNRRTNVSANQVRTPVAMQELRLEERSRILDKATQAQRSKLLDKPLLSDRAKTLVMELESRYLPLGDKVVAEVEANKKLHHLHRLNADSRSKPAAFGADLVSKTDAMRIVGTPGRMPTAR